MSPTAARAIVALLLATLAISACGEQAKPTSVSVVGDVSGQGVVDGSSGGTKPPTTAGQPVTASTR